MGTIFDEASHSGEKNHEHENKKNTSHSAHVPPKSRGQIVKKYGDRDAKIADMLKRMNEMKTDIDHKIAYLYEQGKRYNINVDRLISTMSHLFVKDYEKIKATETLIKEQLSKTNPSNASSHAPKSSSEKLTQERKAKTRGARKKWIPLN